MSSSWRWSNIFMLVMDGAKGKTCQLFSTKCSPPPPFLQMIIYSFFMTEPLLLFKYMYIMPIRRYTLKEMLFFFLIYYQIFFFFFFDNSFFFYCRFILFFHCQQSTTLTFIFKCWPSFIHSSSVGGRHGRDRIGST